MSMTETRKRWREAVLLQRDSGLSIKEFCEQRKLSRPSFFLWRKRLGMKATKAVDPALPAPSGKNKPAERESKGFMRLLQPSPMGAWQNEQGGDIYIETPNGYRVAAGCNGEDGLKSVLGVIKCL